MTTELDQPRRFYDGGTADGSPDPAAPPLVALEQAEGMHEDDFRMTRRIAYLDRRHGELLVPKDPSTFVTDLASVPSIFAWLVPRTGAHLRAALVHDALLEQRGEGLAYVGPAMPAEEAHRVFREGLADSDVGLVRRWLMWTAVMLASMLNGRGAGWSTAELWRWRITVVGTLLLVALLGVLSTLDVLDVAVPLIGGVPWTGDGQWWVRLGTGAAGAVVVPFVLGLAWGRFRIAGIITGIALALLLHVTVALIALTGVYKAVEWLSGRAPRVALALGGVLVLVSAVVFTLALAW